MDCLKLPNGMNAALEREKKTFSKQGNQLVILLYDNTHPPIANSLLQMNVDLGLEVLPYARHLAFRHLLVSLYTTLTWSVI